MKAIVIHDYGTIEQLTETDMPMPELNHKDVLIKVRAAAVNPVDCAIRSGWFKERFQYPMPYILGWDVAGEVEEVGAEASHFEKGDFVFSRSDSRRNGAYAEYIAVDEAFVAKMPRNLSFTEAASIPLVGLTAWQAVVDEAQLKSGERILIHAGAGGVGTFAIQLAKSIGAYVITTASSRNRDFLLSLGADEVIDYTVSDFTNEVKEVDVVLDSMGGEIQTRSYQTLRRGGRLVALLNPPDANTAKHYDVEAHHIFVHSDGKELAEIAELLEQGTIRPVVGTTLPLTEQGVREAHALSETHHVRGKIVLVPGD